MPSAAWLPTLLALGIVMLSSGCASPPPLPVVVQPPPPPAHLLRSNSQRVEAHLNEVRQLLQEVQTLFETWQTTTPALPSAPPK